MCAKPCRSVQPEGVEDLFRVDVCTRCAFIWFDPGELEVLPSTPAPDVSPEPTGIFARPAVDFLTRPWERGVFERGWQPRLPCRQRALS